MFHLSQRMKAIKPSPTLSINAKAMALKHNGQLILNLALGEPDFDTPDFIKQGAINALHAGETKYTPTDGTALLKQAVIKKFQQQNNLTYIPNQISVSNGVKQIFFNAFMVTLNAGDEVIVPAPYWVSYPDMIALADGISVIVQCPQENNFKITPAQLEEAITPRTKWLVLNSPSNPTGAVYTAEELRSLAIILRKHPQVMIACDDIYEHFLYDHKPFVTLAQIAPDLFDRILTANGVSKSYSMTGWRIGYAGGPDWLISAMGILQSQSTSNPCSIAQAAAVVALEGPVDFLQDWCLTFKERRDLVVNSLNKISGISCFIPSGAFYVYPTCVALIGKKTPNGKVLMDDVAFAEFLLEKAGVAVVPGTAFGLSPYFRISYATSIDVLSKACNAIAVAVETLK